MIQGFNHRIKALLAVKDDEFRVILEQLLATRRHLNLARLTTQQLYDIEELCHELLADIQRKRRLK